jgi:hypothetical protein
MTYRYGHDWNVRMSQPIDEIDEAAARDRFVSGPQLSVSKVPEDGAAVPVYTLVLGPGGGHVRVARYDANGSVVETYDYSHVEGEERLFLDNHKAYVYADDAAGPQRFSQSRAHKAWVFRPDGTATCREVVKGIDDARVSEYHELDVSGHWRERPAFGDWDVFGEAPEPSTPLT